MEEVTVVIPAYEEEETIGKVIGVAKGIHYVTEVIVVDGYSSDNTIKEAERAGARVILQEKRMYPGKGVALQTGVREAKGNIVVFLDADIMNITPKFINLLAKPILYEDYDFVKGTFERKAGRVTELTAKPLLELLFPELKFSQPLSGEFAGKKSFFEKIKFVEDWGIDVALLIDALMLGAKVKEVHLGFKNHIMKPLHELIPMAKQVAATIIQKAHEYGRLIKPEHRLLAEGIVSETGEI